MLLNRSEYAARVLDALMPYLQTQATTIIADQEGGDFLLSDVTFAQRAQDVVYSSSFSKDRRIDMASVIWQDLEKDLKLAGITAQRLGELGFIAANENQNFLAVDELFKAARTQGLIPEVSAP